MTFWAIYNNDVHAIMTRDEVRNVDAWAINSLRIPGVILMENAGRGAAEIALAMLSEKTLRRVCVFCGSGNNGGDGFVIARHLANCGTDVQIILCAPPEKIQGDALTHLTVCRQMNLPIQTLDLSGNTVCRQVREVCAGCGLIIDALFGTGLTGELASPYAGLIACLNSLNIPILAVDIPSGLDCDLGIPLPVCIEATATVSFVAAKRGFFQSEQAAQTVGTLYIASIGITTKKARV
jgi:NAD(P)H-hydrate epimerase